MDNEPSAKILELKERIKGLNLIVQEAQECSCFKESGFYPILNRTLTALDANYRIEAFKAAKSNLSAIGNYLGRMEMISDFYAILDNFGMNADQAQKEIDACMGEIKDLNEQIRDDARSQNTTDIGGSMG